MWNWLVLEKAFEVKAVWYTKMHAEVVAGICEGRTEPFPYVNFPDGVYEQPDWLSRQQASDPNYQGQWIASTDGQRVEDRNNGHALNEADVLGLPAGQGAQVI